MYASFLLISIIIVIVIANVIVTVNVIIITEWHVIGRT